MPRVLIISPHFPPLNAPDMQRVRMSLPHFVAAGWEVVVLTVDDPQPQAPVDPQLGATVPAEVEVVRVPAYSRSWTRRLGVNNPALRALPRLHRAGRRLLASRRFDLVYFSTTQFIVLPLGRLWRREFGVPYVIDLQDPWLNDHYERPGAERPPGGWKYRIARAEAKLLEGWTLRRCAHVISVSEGYGRTLLRRYPWFRATPFTVITFGSPDHDLVRARELAGMAPALLPSRPTFKIAYAGRLGADMVGALDVLFAGLAAFRDATRPIEVFFFGTSYAAAGDAAATTTQLAARHGISALVHEQPARIGYLDSLRLLLESDLNVVLGSADASYSPSKLYPTLQAGKPTLAIAPAGSVLEARVNELGGAALVAFGAGAPADTASRVRTLLAQFVASPTAAFGRPVDRARLDGRYSAAAVATAQVQVFSQVRDASAGPAGVDTPSPRSS